EAERGNAAGIDHALDPRPHRLLHEVAGAFDVRRIDFALVARPEAIVGRYVGNVADAGDRACERRPIAQVALDKVEIEPGEVGPRTLAANERPHRKTRLDQAARDGRADETARSRHQNLFVTAHAGAARSADGRRTRLRKSAGHFASSV